MTTDYSRTLRLAERASSSTQSPLRARVEEQHVLVTLDPDEAATFTTARVLVANLRRLPVKLTLDPDAGDRPLTADERADLVDVAADIDPDLPLHLGLGLALGYTVHLHVGTGPTTAALRGVPDGHGTQLRPAGHTFLAQRSNGTGLGAVVTAAMLTAEAFKVVVDIRAGRHSPARPIDFCPVSLASPDAAGPMSVPTLDKVALIGVGAIGTAITFILRELQAQGELTVVDPQIFDDPNVTTYSLGSIHDAAEAIPKVDLVARELPLVQVTPIHGTAQDLIDAIDAGRAPMPEVVLGAVDSIEARHEIARIHASHTFDGSTGGAAGTTLSLAESNPHGPCLRCYYPVTQPSGPSAEQRLADLTGLPLQRIARGQEPITEDDVALVTTEHRAAVEALLGKPICGLGKALALTGVDDAFSPSASFVAQQAAALVVASLIRHANGTSTGTVDLQYDALFGPRENMVDARRPSPGCRCQNDEIIQQVRDRRRGTS